MSIFVYSLYSPEFATCARSVASLPLDPIDCAGIINAEVQKLLAEYAPFARDAYLMINDFNYCMARLKKNTPGCVKEPPPVVLGRRQKVFGRITCIIFIPST